MEIVVLSICILGSACDYASRAYYAQSVDAQRIANEAQVAIEHKMGAENAAIVGSMFGVMVLRKGTINMQRHLNLLIDERSMQLQAHWEH